MEIAKEVRFFLAWIGAVLLLLGLGISLLDTHSTLAGFLLGVAAGATLLFITVIQVFGDSNER